MERRTILPLTAVQPTIGSNRIEWNNGGIEMDVNASECQSSVSDVNNDQALLQLGVLPRSGIALLQEPIGHDGTLGMKPDAGDFLKWVRSQHPDIALAFPSKSPKAVLHSSDIWLPLIYLASDTSVQLFLNMLSSYLYDRAKGALRGEESRVHLSLIYEDKVSKKVKRFEYEGSSADVKKLMDKFDANNFFNDAP